MTRVWLERLAIAVFSLALAVLLISLLSGYFTSHDVGSVTGAGDVGLHFADQGDELLAPGSRRPRYDSNPPTSGPHVPVPVRADGRTLSDDQILEALSAGDVVILYGSARPPAGLVAFARATAGPFTPALAAAGQAVVLGRRVGAVSLTALAWTRLLRVRSVRDPLLREFVAQWLGRGPRLSSG